MIRDDIRQALVPFRTLKGKSISTNIDVSDICTSIMGFTRTEKQLNREINYTVLKNSEFQLQKKRRDAFITELIFGSRIMLLGDEEEFVSG